MGIYRRQDRPDDLRWWISWRDAAGRWRRKCVGSHSDALKEHDRRRAAAADGKKEPTYHDCNRRMDDLMDEYWNLHGRFMKSKSWKTYFGHIRIRFGQMRATSIRGSHVQEYYNSVLQRTSPSNANKNLTLMKGIFNRLKQLGSYHGGNPCDGVKKMKENNERDRYLDVEEIRRLLEVAHPRLYPAVVCALMTGMRRGEILSLRWKDVDMPAGFIKIRSAKTKSGYGRKIPITSKLRKVLESLPQHPADRVFELPEISLVRYFKKAVTEAGLVDFKFHDLRHTFASHFVMRTSDLPTLQKLLGHRSPVMTQRYAHLCKGHLVSEMAVFESAMPIEENGNLGSGSHSTTHSTKAHPTLQESKKIV